MLGHRTCTRLQTRLGTKVKDLGIQGQRSQNPRSRTWTVPCLKPLLGTWKSKVKDVGAQCQGLGQCQRSRISEPNVKNLDSTMLVVQNLHEAANEFITLRNKRGVKGKNKDCKRRLVRRRNARLRDVAMAVGSEGQTDNEVRSDKFGSSRFTSLNNAETSVSHDRSANTLVSAFMYQLPVLVLRNERKPASPHQPAQTNDIR